jgi:hypothetical protein
MLRWMRAGRLRIAATLFVCLATAAASRALPLHGDESHDVACSAAVAGPHDESAHRIRSGATTAKDGPHPLHCLVCHWARAFRPLTSSSVQPAPPLEAQMALHFTELPTPASILPAQLTLRSPPLVSPAR